MNTQNNPPQTNSLSIRTIVNFPLLTTEPLCELIETLGFKMGLAELRFCQNSFRNLKMNNPTINELKIIDRVFYDYSKRPSAPLVASFLTNDKTVADTYADLMARRKVVDPDYTAPCSVNDMLDILPQYLGQNNSANIVLFAGKNRNTELSCLGHKRIAETGNSHLACAAGVKLKATSPISNGNIVYAILKSFNPEPDFNEKLEKLLASSDVIKSVKQSHFFEDESVISVLASLGRGIKLDTTNYEGKDGAISPFEPLADGDTGVLAVFEKQGSVDMLLTAQFHGLRVIPLGYIVTGDSIDGVSLSGERLSLKIPFLKTLAFSRPMTCEADGDTPDTPNLDSSVYININNDKYRMNSAICGGENYFMAGFNSVLYSYSLSVMCGENTVSTASTYTLPLNNPSEKDLGKSVELILGAYRAECEFSISDPNFKIQIGEKPSLCFHTLSKTRTSTPSSFVGKGSKIYYLEPVYNENSLPDFENLKQMHTYIKSLIARGVILSIRPTTNSIDKTLEKMSGTVKPEIYESQKPASHFGGFIIESATDIQGILIGETAVQA